MINVNFWQDVLESLKGKMSQPAFQTWFGNSTAAIEEDVITVQVENKFVAEWVEERYQTLLFETVKDVMGQTYEIEITTPSTSLNNETNWLQDREEKTSLVQRIHTLEEQLENVLAKVYQQDDRIKELEKIIGIGKVEG